MLNYNLDSTESADNLLKICGKYKGKMEIDIICGRQIIDAYSVLGVYSLVGHVVSIETHSRDGELKERFAKDLEILKNPDQNVKNDFFNSVSDEDLVRMIYKAGIDGIKDRK